MMPSTELRSALPEAWIDRLFLRLAALYGRQWIDMWADVPMVAVKDAWTSELEPFTADQIGAALKALGKFPPTLPEFVALCKPQPVALAHRLMLPSPRGQREPIPQHIRDVMAKVRAKVQT